MVAGSASGVHWMQFIAECGIEYGCQFVTLFSFNSPDCLYTKKFCDFFQSYEKTRAEQNKLDYFLCRVHCNLFRVTKKRVKCKRKACFSFHFRESVTSPKEKLRKKNEKWKLNIGNYEWRYGCDEFFSRTNYELWTIFSNFG